MNVHKMDIRGQVCPSCLLLVLREVNQQHRQMMAGHLSLEVLTDNRDATSTVSEAVSNMGLGAISEKVNGYYRITIKHLSDVDPLTGQSR